MLLWVAAGGAPFSFAISLMRRLRRNMVAEADLGGAAPTLEALPVHLYNTVIQQLKRNRSTNYKYKLSANNVLPPALPKTSARPCCLISGFRSTGVWTQWAGLCKFTIPAAKEYLWGFRSLSGMSAEEIFR